MSPRWRQNGRHRFAMPLQPLQPDRFDSESADTLVSNPELHFGCR